MPRCVIDSAMDARLRALNVCGLSEHQIALRVGLGRQTIRDFYRRKGVPSNFPGVGNRGPSRDTYVSSGYVNIRQPGHPKANKEGLVLEHIVVAEKILGRRILPTEQVHHIDGSRNNNSPENIVVLPSSAHKSHHAKIRWAKERARA